MDQFYQTLRKIQKKERNNGTLARVEETFYPDIHNYLDSLKQKAMTDPFSNAHGLLKEAQIIATEICERREHKITDAAVVNIHRSYSLFIGEPQFDLIDTTPLNLTPEEEKFYFSIIDTLKNHRENISLEKLSEDTEIKPKKEVISKQTNTLDTKIQSKTKLENDDRLNRLDEISKAKPIVEKRETIEKQIAKSKVSIEENPNAHDGYNEFIDLESKKIAKDSELVKMIVFDDVGAIVGVDEKIYGPFRPQDIVIIPKINAKIFVKNRKGRLVKV